MTLFDRIREKSTPAVRKIVFLCFAGLTSILGLILLFIPFIQFYYKNTGNLEISPFLAFSYIFTDFPLENEVSIFSIVLLLLWFAYAVIVGIWFTRTMIRFAGEAERIKRRAKGICIFNSVVLSTYCIGGVVFNIVNRSLGGSSNRAHNLWLLIVCLLVDVLFALYLGILREESFKKEDEEKAATAPKRKELQKKKWETFLFASLLLFCAMGAFLTKIVNITYVGSDAALKGQDLSMRGLDVLRHYTDMETTAQILAFVLFLAITLIASFYFLAGIALLSKSNVFFQFALGSVIASCVGCFLIGMYGKYYEMLQSINVGAIASWVDYKVRALTGVSVDLGPIKEEFLENYQISSDSFYFFLGAVVVVGGLLARRSYSKGLILERELEPTPLGLLAKINNAEIDVEGVEHNDELVHTPSISSANAVTDGASSYVSDPCPAFTELDETVEETLAEVEKRKVEEAFEDPTLPKLVQFIVQYARDSRLHLFYTVEDIATFIAGLGATKLTILQGMSGTGKTSLPKIFSEALYSKCEIIEVESSWRDKNELLGYYNEFSKAYTPKKFTQALYEASMNPETLTFIVLDEMNLSRIEYYFSDFLSLMENEPDKREIKLLNVGLFRRSGERKIPYKGLRRGHTLKVPPNVWFIGTANRDESTFEISDKVYDRAHTMNFNRRAKKVHCYNDPLPQKFLSADKFNELLDEAKKSMDFNVESYPVIAEVEKLLAPYNISFGNRIAMQIENFVAVYCACFTQTEEVIHDAVERILLTKVVAKLELKSIEDKEELAAAFENLGLTRCSEFISKLNED